MQNPKDTHWKVVNRVLRYLAGTLHHGLHLKPSNHLLLTCYCDSNLGSDIEDIRSISGCCVYFGLNLIYWISKKQTVVSWSSIEAEYRSLANVICDILWL